MTITTHRPGSAVTTGASSVSVDEEDKHERNTNRADKPVPRNNPSTLILIAALLGFFIITLDATAVNVALPSIGGTFGGATAALQWILDAYTLTFAALMLSAGALSDRAGANRVYGLGLVVFTLASAACGLAPGLGLMIGARLVQGGAAAVMLPSSLALVRQAFPEPARRAMALALWTVGGAVSLALGPVVGGLLTSALSWRWIFFVNVPVGLVTVLLLLARVPASPRRAAALDPVGQLAAAAALSTLIYALIQGGSSGFGRPSVLICLALFVLAAAAFVVVESRVADPMTPLGLFRDRVVVLCVGTGFVVNAAYYGSLFMLSLFYQQVLGMSAVTAGLMFLPMAGLTAVANIGSAKIAQRFGPRVPITVGQLVCAAAMCGLIGVNAHTSAFVTVALTVPFGLGLGFAVPSLTAAMLGSVPAERAGLAGGVFNSARQTGGAVAVAAFGTLVSSGGSFASGMHTGLLVSAIMLLITAAAAPALLGRRARPRTSPEPVSQG